ncbi:hypothetical protein ACCUM_1116 [Candidatus Accumulibacter phosphatis]|uniref:Uncharacterized protein n=1 Tax=Candidatus Accumulibacter phosphatis TaxID=327160 RepID=A0A5S4ESS4_9PROT|nr:hypothetical protein ACCUM_1116 [Candidatus Accumulibacter phosphatis]
MRPAREGNGHDFPDRGLEKSWPLAQPHRVIESSCRRQAGLS